MKRRDFLKAGSLTATAAALGTTGVAKASIPEQEDVSKYAPTALEPEYTIGDDRSITFNPNQRMAFTMCFGCYSTCAVRARIDNKTGKVLRVAGNPYGPSALDQPLDLDTPPREAFQRLSAVNDQGLNARSTLCGRGNSVVDAMDDPRRITKCLKRAGKRGENKWQTISYEQMIKEVTEGGDLFGEGHVDGLKAIHQKNGLANPDFPDFGPGRNQLFASICSDQLGRKDFMNRFLQKSWGTPNVGVKSAYCGVMPGLVDVITPSTIDINHCEYAIFIGFAPSLGGDSTNIQARRFGEAMAGRDNFKYVVVDPILRSLTSKANRQNSEWVPIKTGTDTALMFAMLQYIINHQRYNEDFLTLANRKAADAAGEVNFTNSTYLVVQDQKHPLYNKFLTAEALGLGDDQTQVVINPTTGKPAASNSVSRGKLFYSGPVRLRDGSEIQVETSMSLLKTRVNETSMADYSAHCQIPVAKIEEMAIDFTSHGRKVGVAFYTGVCSPDTTQFVFATGLLGTMVGAHNAKGGMNYSAGSAFSGTYDIYSSPLYDLNGFEHTPVEGLSTERAADYEQSHEYREKIRKGLPPYPADSSWLPTKAAPLNSASYLISHANSNPFQFKAWINWSTNPMYGAAGLAGQVTDTIKDPKQLGLIIGVDVFINETNQYADYFVPDLSQYEQWSMSRMGSSRVRGQSACAPAIDSKNVKNQKNQTVCMEQFVIDLAKAMDLKGFGDKAFKDKDGQSCALHTPEDYYTRVYANLAHADKPLPQPTQDDLEITSVNRVASMFSERLKPEELGPTLFLLSRGGRYKALDSIYEGEFFHKSLCSPFQFQVYNEGMTDRKDSHTGKPYDGLPVFDVHRFRDGTPIRELWTEKEFPYQISTYKPHLRSASSAILPRITSLADENFIQMHEEAAAKEGLKNGDLAIIRFPNNKTLKGIVQADKGVAMDTICIAHGYGHKALGAQDMTIDGELKPGIAERGKGLSTNLVGVGDPTCKGPALLQEQYVGGTIRHTIPVAIQKA
ncbi:molybdopterin-dependent oxidoreductase [Endozoicomonas sp. 4G]|uniref:molybdopterin-dependent oxidoreductase n=1 Tax=Endozoicomonas sp. 4G TaxID=2872754 RepID=UPI00207888D4|nr:molybdopterin-dependent oxidoreductase [Endozoicomonas sp. 4G]